MVLKLLLCLFVLAGPALAAQITLIYPRLEADQDTFRYRHSIDSTFVLGHVRGHNTGDTLWCNGFPLNLTKDGAFLAFLPIPWQSETFAWNFALTHVGAETSRLSFPFGCTEDSEPAAWIELNPPAAFVVKDPAAHTRTVIGGSYHLFPDSGTILRVIAVTEMWLQFEIASGMSGVIERRFTDSLGIVDAESHVVLLGNGTVRQSGDTLQIAFSTTSRSLVESFCDPDGDELMVRLFNSAAAIDRIRYADSSRDVISDVSWSQHIEGVTLTIDLATPIRQGYRVAARDSSLIVYIFYPQYAKSDLRGKRIVLDPGHGGAADGSIGPLGAKEKDVVLKWSELLTKELRDKGAEVIVTRTDDRALSLYDRVRIARASGADAYLSLHTNALPDGENPYLRRGCGTYYYQPLSRPLAESIQSAIVSQTGQIDDGVFDANFAVVRPTDFPAVLIEAAYIIHPDEEQKLNDKKFLLDLSRGVVNGLLDYFSNASAR